MAKQYTVQHASKHTDFTREARGNVFKMAPVKSKYQEGEKILCYHGPLIYEARVLKVQLKEKQLKYLVHYNGWNSKWDEWVPEERAMKINEANLKKQMEVEKDASAKGSKLLKRLGEGKKRHSGPATPSMGQPDNKQAKKESNDSEKGDGKSIAAAVEAAIEGKKIRSKQPTCVESEYTFNDRQEVKIRIPEQFKPFLIDDAEHINKQKKLVSLPGKNTVENIVGEYVAVKTGKPGGNRQRELMIEQIAEGIKKYFDVALGTQLLYVFERPQYEDMKRKYPDRAMSEIYGAIHLLRLFVNMGEYLSYTRLSEKSMQNLVVHLHDFLRFFLKHKSNFFTKDDYIVASPDYNRKAL